MTASSVMMRETQARPVRGSEQASRILCAPPLAVCSIVMTTRVPLETRSIAPPMPLTILPGMIQFARSPLLATCSAPRMVRSTFFARIMPKLSELEKMLAPAMGLRRKRRGGGGKPNASEARRRGGASGGVCVRRAAPHRVAR